MELDPTGRVKDFHPKPRTGDRYYRNCATPPSMCFRRGSCVSSPGGNSPISAGISCPVCAGQMLWGYNTPEYIEDVGTPLRLEETERDILSGKFARLSRKTPRGAVFLARDGVLNAAVDRWVSAEQLQLLPVRR